MTIERDDDDLEDAQDEGIWYRWLCPHCIEVNESENDTRGDVVECTACGQKARHRG